MAASSGCKLLFVVIVYIGVFSSTTCYQRKPHYYNIDLDAPATNRWDKVVDDFRDEVYLAAKVLKAHIPPKLLPIFERIAASVDHILPSPFAVELKAISIRANVPLGELIILNLIYGLTAFGCTSIVAQSSTGQIWHGRNLDYGSNSMEKQILSNITLQLNFQRNGTTMFSASSYAGFVGVVNGQRHKAFSVSMDERDTGSIVENLYMMLDGAMSVPMLLRQVLDTPLNYRQALKTFATTRISAPAYLIIGGTQSEEGAVITRDRKSAADIWELDLKQNRWFVLETNYDHWKPPPKSDDRRTPGNKAMIATGREGFNGKSMFKVLSVFPVLNQKTTFTAIMSAVDPNAFDTFVR